MSSSNEVEIKFRFDDRKALEKRLRKLGFQETTPRTHEMNTLYDRDSELRSRGEVLRLRNYGERWTVTHKSKGEAARHKSRLEIETEVADGGKLDRIFVALGYKPRFRYEKYRAQWSDGEGHVVLDETPIGNFGEIEGAPEWIDGTAERLGVREYITDNYATLFVKWKSATGSRAENMTFEEVRR